MAPSWPIIPKIWKPKKKLHVFCENCIFVKMVIFLLNKTSIQWTLRRQVYLSKKKNILIKCALMNNYACHQHHLHWFDEHYLTKAKKAKKLEKNNVRYLKTDRPMDGPTDGRTRAITKDPSGIPMVQNGQHFQNLWYSWPPTYYTLHIYKPINTVELANF